MMFIENKYNLGDCVYLKTDTEQQMRMVTGINITPGNLLYELSVGDKTSRHYEFELSETEDIVMKSKN